MFRLLVAGVTLLLLFAAGAGAQTTVPKCLGETATIVGTEGNDVLTGTDDDDVILGLGGDDILTGGPEGFATDVLCGGEGNDTLNGGNGLIAALSGEGGDDRYEPGDVAVAFAVYLESPAPVLVDLALGTVTGWGTDTMVGIDSVVGSPHDDVLSGDAKENFLDGRGGNDRLMGLGGNDLLDGDAGNDLIDGGLGQDTGLFGAPQRVRIDLGARTATGWGTDRLVSIENAEGSRFGDVLRGSNGRNSLSGGGGNDSLTGLGGADQLNAEAGNDRLAGGAGADRLDGGTGRDQGDGGPGRDRCVKIERKKRCP
jgi:Ca2+-binding RTX toxin-like protein